MTTLSAKHVALLLLLCSVVFGATLLYVSLPHRTVGSNRDTASLVAVAQAHPEQEVARRPTVQAGEGWPVGLAIPSINVTTPLEYVGLTVDGIMDVPADPGRAGWYKLGVSPGQLGSAIIAGHLDGKNGAVGVFSNLSKLKPGDMLYTKNDQGNIASFVVRETRNYDPQADASAVFHSHDGQAHLNLITCEGVWNEQEKSYSQRLVVFADKE